MWQRLLLQRTGHWEQVSPYWSSGHPIKPNIVVRAENCDSTNCCIYSQCNAHLPSFYIMLIDSKYCSTKKKRHVNSWNAANPLIQKIIFRITLQTRWCQKFPRKKPKKKKNRFQRSYSNTEIIPKKFTKGKNIMLPKHSSVDYFVFITNS